MSLPASDHQVGHLVDDDDDVGQRIEIELFFLVDCLAGFLVEAGVHVRVSVLACVLLAELRAIAVDIATPSLDMRL